MKFCFECPFFSLSNEELLRGYCKMGSQEVNIDESECITISQAILEYEVDKSIEQLIIDVEGIDNEFA